MWLWVTIALAADPCDSFISRSQLQAELDDVAMNYRDQDWERAEIAFDAAMKSLPCVDETLGTNDAASLHLAEAFHRQLSWPMAEMDAGSIRAYRSLTILLPDDRLLEPLKIPRPFDWGLLEQARSLPFGDAIPVVVPSGWSAWVDGRRSGTRPMDRPAVIQLFEPDGLVWTGYVLEGTAEPSWTFPTKVPSSEPWSASEESPSRRVGVDSSTPTQRPGSRKRFRKYGLLASGLVVLVPAGTFWALSAVERGKMRQAVTVDELDAAYNRQVGFAATAYSLLGVSALGLSLYVAL